MDAKSGYFATRNNLVVLQLCEETIGKWKVQLFSFLMVIYIKHTYIWSPTLKSGDKKSRWGGFKQVEQVWVKMNNYEMGEAGLIYNTFDQFF